MPRKKNIFDSLWVSALIGDWKIPFFPGGLTVGGLWFINLVAAFIVRFRWDKKSIGILISHGGLILLLIGQFLSQALALERQMPVDVGETRSYSEDFRDFEIVFLRGVDEKTDEVTSIPYSIFTAQARDCAAEQTHFIGDLQMVSQRAAAAWADPDTLSIATMQGIGARVQVQEMQPVTTDDENNQVTAYVEIFDAWTKSLGIWLISSGLGAPQAFTAGGQEYRIYLRPRRYYHPFAITLKEFKHDVYLGTDIPKNFSSLLHIDEPGKAVSRDTLVYMNHPLRYEGLTFYQASFAKGDQQSIFQVVQNPAWLIPYLSCALIIFGMALQFGLHLLGFVQKGRGQ